MSGITTKPLHINWLRDTKERIKTTDGKTIVIFEFCYEMDEAVLSSWAKYFRSHYCNEEEIDYLREGLGLSRAEYLKAFIFPDTVGGLGPSIRAGDFGEILISDFIEFLLGYWVPRTRYNRKEIRNESTKGCDVIGFKILKDGEESAQDILMTFEVKTQFSGNKADNRLQDAVTDSSKDPTRLAESLNSRKRRLWNSQKFEEAKKVVRFQSPEDHPYRQISGAAALFSSHLFDPNVIQATCCESHPNVTELVLLIIRGDNLMRLVHELYRRAADEA